MFSVDTRSASHVTMIHMQVITKGRDGWRCPTRRHYPQIKHVSEIPNVKNYYEVTGRRRFRGFPHKNMKCERLTFPVKLKTFRSPFKKQSSDSQ